MTGIKRDALSAISRLLKQFPVVAVIGARQVGKTTLLKQLMPRAPFFDLEKRADYELIRRDPDFFLSQQNVPIVIDEAQALPDLFPALRVAVDARRDRPGRFLISGSSSPELLKHIHESLAGRIAVYELGGLTVAESWHTAISPLYGYIAGGDSSKLLRMQPSFTAAQLMESCVFGGYPEPFIKYRRKPEQFDLWMDNYFASYVQRDIRNLFPGINADAFQRFIAMLATSSGNQLNFSDFARSLEISSPTVKKYFEIAHGTFVWRMMPSYEKNAAASIVKMPRGYMRDSGLLNHIIGIHTVQQLQAHHQLGRIWEGFVIEQLLKGFTQLLLPVKPYYYRTKNAAEIDLIFECAAGVIPVEVKLGATIPSRGLTSMKDFIEQHKCPCGIVINNADRAAMIAPKIIQIPAGCL